MLLVAKCTYFDVHLATNRKHNQLKTNLLSQKRNKKVYKNETTNL